MGEKNMDKLMAIVSMLGDTDITNQKWYTGIVQTIIDWMNALLMPIIIIVATAGMIYAIFLGIQLARAESADKREEAKKRMLWFILAFVLTILLLVVIQLLITNESLIKDLINGGLDGNSYTSKAA